MKKTAIFMILVFTVCLAGCAREKGKTEKEEVKKPMTEKNVNWIDVTGKGHISADFDFTKTMEASEKEYLDGRMENLKRSPYLCDQPKKIDGMEYVNDVPVYPKEHYESILIDMKNEGNYHMDWYLSSGAMTYPIVSYCDEFYYAHLREDGNLSDEDYDIFMELTDLETDASFATYDH